MTDKPLSEMDDAEFINAMSRKGWRSAAVARVAPPEPAPPTTTSNPGDPPPADAPTPTKPALGMSDAEFTQAMRTRAWRTGHSNI